MIRVNHKQILETERKDKAFNKVCLHAIIPIGISRFNAFVKVLLQLIVR